jgi:rod shape-determining protein MreD
MWGRQTLLCVTLVFLALVTQQSFLARVGLPGATPDLLLVTVIALAFAYGPLTGAVVGFGAGMALDFAPSTAGPIGVVALIFMVMGFVSGAAVDPRDRNPPVLIGIIGLSCGAFVIAFAAITSVLGNERVDWEQAPSLLLTATLYGALLGLAVVPAVSVLVAKVTPEAVQ